ncbi:MAG: glycosyltransferase family 4 protein [Acidimicrobiales bacterium]
MRPTLLVTNDFPPKVGGIQAYLFELWSRLDPATTTVLTARSSHDHAAFDAAQAERGPRIVRTGSPLLYLPTFRTLRRIRSLCQDMRPGLVLLDPAWPLGLLGPFIGTPYGLILHGAEISVPARIPLVRRTMSWTLRRAALVVSAGHYAASEAARAGRGPLRQVVEIPPGIDAGRFTRLEGEARLVAREQLGIPQDAFAVVSVCRLVPRKGIDILIKAAAALAPRHSELCVVIAGAGRDDARLRRLIARQRAPVQLLGRVSEGDKLSLLGAADAFVQPCRNRWGGLEQEGFGIVFLEAAACGLPQVAGDSGGAAEAVVDGETGLVVSSPGDYREVARAVEQLLEDPDLVRRLGSSARERVEKDFDYAALASRLADALAKVSG